MLKAEERSDVLALGLFAVEFPKKMQTISFCKEVKITNDSWRARKCILNVCLSVSLCVCVFCVHAMVCPFKRC